MCRHPKTDEHPDFDSVLAGIMDLYRDQVEQTRLFPFGGRCADTLSKSALNLCLL